jgi:transcriptional regulator with XRE-family HTH domain
MTMNTRYYRTSPARTARADHRRGIERLRSWATSVSWPAAPSRGWLAEVRQASGLSTRDVADRLGVSQSVVVRLEESERRETVQLAQLRRYAEAIDADLRYAVVPRASVLAVRDSTGELRRSGLRIRARRGSRRTVVWAASAAPSSAMPRYYGQPFGHNDDL